MTMKKHAHRRGHEQRRALGVAERDSLRHELADHDVQEGEEQVGEGATASTVAMNWSNSLRQRLLAEGTDGQ